MIYDLSNAIYRIQLRSDKKPTRAEAIFSDFIRLVEQNYRSERRVGWYAHEMCITAKYLSETVKMVSRRTPNDWIDNYVVMELRVLLKNTTKSIKEISQDMCFPNRSFMGKYFKEHVACRPCPTVSRNGQAADGRLHGFVLLACSACFLIRIC